MKQPGQIPDLPLRDIHLPDPIGWWPPAPGWWILVALFIAAVFFTVRWLLRRQRRLSVRRSAAQALSNIKTDYQNHQDAKRLVRDLSELIRRIAISVTSRQTAASLTGKAWLEYLDEMINQPCFNSEEGKLLIEAPYTPSSQVNGDRLLQLSETWIEKATTGVKHHA